MRMVKESIRLERLLALLCGGLALVALALSCIGLWGVMAYNVTRRVNEIGIRMALGARPSDVAWSVLREAIVLAGKGAASVQPSLVCQRKGEPRLADNRGSLREAVPPSGWIPQPQNAYRRTKNAS